MTPMEKHTALKEFTSSLTGASASFINQLVELDPTSVLKFYEAYRLLDSAQARSDYLELFIREMSRKYPM